MSCVEVKTKTPSCPAKHLQGDQVYIYKVDAHSTLIEGYPKSLKEELGIEGQVDAAFVCPNEHLVHIIQGECLVLILIQLYVGSQEINKHLCTHISSNRIEDA